MLARLLLLASIPTALLFSSPQDDATPATFSRDTIHLGVVVGDLEASAAFYARALGLTELDGFSVPGEFCNAAGLTDERPLSVRVFSTNAENPEATNIKLMQVDGVESKRSDNGFIHSQLGFSYLTVFVADLGRALERVAELGGAPLADGPVPLREGEQADWLALVRDPDGNLIELIGPRR